ncbi:MAG: Maf family nucleotide pyrophosphatase [Burkholderiaceae bacterium]|jgi:septum formation protein|nr:Maf family nucleotide pyrophosphatase [Burkholderiaceae bacterium]
MRYEKIYLASNSPRRRALLQQIGVRFEHLPLPSSANGNIIDEDRLPDESPRDYVERVSRDKARFAWHWIEQNQLPLLPVLSADTVVSINSKILWKPQNRQEAMHTTKALSGRTHSVLTSVCVKTNDATLQMTQESEVRFAVLSDREIDAYCQTEEPYDKAGGYAIQGKAAKFITYISGSYSGIMGLPLYETVQLLCKAGVYVP